MFINITGNNTNPHHPDYLSPGNFSIGGSSIPSNHVESVASSAIRTNEATEEVNEIRFHLVDLIKKEPEKNKAKIKNLLSGFERIYCSKKDVLNSFILDSIKDSVHEATCALIKTGLDFNELNRLYNIFPHKRPETDEAIFDAYIEKLQSLPKPENIRRKIIKIFAASRREYPTKFVYKFAGVGGMSFN